MRLTGRGRYAHYVRTTTYRTIPPWAIHHRVVRMRGMCVGSMSTQVVRLRTTPSRLCCVVVVRTRTMLMQYDTPLCCACTYYHYSCVLQYDGTAPGHTETCGRECSYFRTAAGGELSWKVGMVCTYNKHSRHSSNIAAVAISAMCYVPARSAMCGHWVDDGLDVGRWLLDYTGSDGRPQTRT